MSLFRDSWAEQDRQREKLERDVWWAALIAVTVAGALGALAWWYWG